MNKSFALLITLLTLTGCEDTCVESYLAIENNSGKDVEITSYRKNVNDSGGTTTISEKKTIINNSKYDKTLKSCGNDASKINFEGLVEGDSIVIDYGDKTKGYSIYTKINDERNPFLLSYQNSDSNDFVYTLTPEDYANAMPKP